MSVGRALWLSGRLDNAVRSQQTTAPDAPQMSALGGWQRTISSQPRIKELGLSQERVLKTQRSPCLDKRRWLRRERHRKEGNLELINVNEPQNRKIPPERKRRWSSNQSFRAEKAESDVLATTEEQKWYKKELRSLRFRLHFCFQGWSLVWISRSETKHQHLGFNWAFLLGVNCKTFFFSFDKDLPFPNHSERNLNNSILFLTMCLKDTSLVKLNLHNRMTYAECNMWQKWLLQTYLNSEY